MHQCQSSLEVRARSFCDHHGLRLSCQFRHSDTHILRLYATRVARGPLGFGLKPPIQSFAYPQRKGCLLANVNGNFRSTRTLRAALNNFYDFYSDGSIPPRFRERMKINKAQSPYTDYTERRLLLLATTRPRHTRTCESQSVATGEIRPMICDALSASHSS